MILGDGGCCSTGRRRDSDRVNKISVQILILQLASFSMRSAMAMIASFLIAHSSISIFSTTTTSSSDDNSCTVTYLLISSLVIIFSFNIAVVPRLNL